MVAVTGASGRIGRWAVDAATQEGHYVRAIDREPFDTVSTANIETVTADATDATQMHAAVDGVDALIHLAGAPNPHNDDAPTVHNTNVVASFNALDAAATHRVRTVCLASSINSIGGAFSRRARYDYFPVDEHHPTYAEDPYSLSKWIAEQQADSVARRHPWLTIASLRIHGAAPDRAFAAGHAQAHPDQHVNHLWGYVRYDEVARACLLTLSARWSGHEVFNIVAPDTTMLTDSATLAAQYWPTVPLRRALPGNAGFYSCAKAERMLGWTHTR